MAFDVGKHSLVPKHSKLSETEKKTLLEKYRIKTNDLPRILPDDPALARLNPAVGDLIRIERKSKTAGLAVYYRAVAED